MPRGVCLLKGMNDNGWLEMQPHDDQVDMRWREKSTRTVGFGECFNPALLSLLYVREASGIFLKDRFYSVDL